MLNFFGLFEVDTLYVVLGLATAILILLIICIVNGARISRMKKHYNAFMDGEDGRSMEEALLKHVSNIRSTSNETKDNTRSIKKLEDEMKLSFCKMGIVKYDAFDEMGGKLSFALCMLDREDSGYLINVMHGKDGCYSYIKEIIHGESYITLGDEEKKALTEAVSCHSERF